MRGACFFAVLTLSPNLSAHVGPSEDVNNRYYKFVPMGDRVQVVYTAFFGNQPSRALRAQIDRDRDGKISVEEGDVFRRSFQQDLNSSVRMSDKNAKAAEVVFTESVLGLNSESIYGGPFSIDLRATICLLTPPEEHVHSIYFTDGFRLQNTGETEIHLDPAPGIRIVSASVNGVSVEGASYRQKDGEEEIRYELRFIGRGSEWRGVDSTCKQEVNPAPEGEDSLSKSWLALGALALASALAALGYSRFRKNSAT